MNEGQARALAAVEREMRQWELDDAAVAAGLCPRSERHGPARSIVYSVRLDHGEVAALERRAAARGLRPSVLARNLICIGLSNDRSATEALGRLEAAVAELRNLIA